MLPVDVDVLLVGRCQSQERLFAYLGVAGSDSTSTLSLDINYNKSAKQNTNIGFELNQLFFSSPGPCVNLY